MKKFISICSQLIFLPVFFFTFYSCTSDETNVTTFDEKSQIILSEVDDENYSNQRESINTLNLPEVELIENIEINSTEGLELRRNIESIKTFDVDYNFIEKIQMTGINSYVYTIPFINRSEELIVFLNNQMISFVIGSEIALSNGNRQFVMKNFNNETFYQLEQNHNGLLGNFHITDSEHGFFPLTENINNINTSRTFGNVSCIHRTNFSECMQCAWEQCSSSWVCGAALALKPVPILAAAATLCAASAVLSIH